MVRRLLSVVFAGFTVVVTLGCGNDPQDNAHNSTGQPPLGNALYGPQPVPADRGERPPLRQAAEEIVVDGCRVLVIDKQDVPSLRDGWVKDFLVKEGSLITPNQVLVQLDDKLARADVAIKEAKQEQSKADFEAAEKTRDEAYKMWKTTEKLHPQGNNEEVAKYKLTYERYVLEAVSKKAAIKLAEQELAQASVILGMHQLKAARSGIVKAIHRKPGEAVKNLEPVLQVYNVDRLRIEVPVERQNATPLREGMSVVIEPNRPAGPMQTLIDHLLDVTAVAVSHDAQQPLIVSASDDGTARVWERHPQTQRWQVRLLLRHPGAVKTVSCTPRGAAENLCLSGGADGRGRLWDLASTHEQPLRELAEAHRGAITCSAFAPDGKTCATGGEDREIRLWDTASGALRYRLPTTHRGAITSLNFTPDSHLVSAGRDNTLRYWKLHTGGAELETTIPQRTGDVPSLDVSPDGQRVLFDQGKTLRVLSLPRGITDGVVRNPFGANFTSFAQFSPDGGLILTAGGAEGRLQLWQTPRDGDRAHEVFQLVPRTSEPATCCAFAPDGSFVVTGSKDRQVTIWRVPSPKEYTVSSRIAGTISFVDRDVTSAARQVRIWVDFQNPLTRDGRPLLMPGDTATVVMAPAQP